VQRAGRQRLKLSNRFFGIGLTVLLQAFGQSGGFLTGNLSGAEIFFHELQANFGEGTDWRTGAEKAGEEPVYISVDAVFKAALLVDKAPASPSDLAQVLMNAVGGGGGLPSAIEQGLGDTEQVQLITAGLIILTLALGFPGVDPQNEVTLLVETLNEVLGVGG